MQAADLQREWTLKRNCSASPAQFGSLLGLLAFGSFVIALVFAFSGAWWVLVFSCVEVIGLALAFVVYARHAGDFERIVLTSHALIIEFNRGNRVSSTWTHPAAARVEFPCSRLSRDVDGALIGIASTMHGVLAVGRYVPLARRAELAREMRSELSAACRGVRRPVVALDIERDDGEMARP